MDTKPIEDGWDTRAFRDQRRSGDHIIGISILHGTVEQEGDRVQRNVIHHDRIDHFMSPGICFKKTCNGCPERSCRHPNDHSQRQVDDQGDVHPEPLGKGLAEQSRSSRADGELTFCANVEQSTFERKRHGQTTKNVWRCPNGCFTQRFCRTE